MRGGWYVCTMDMGLIEEDRSRWALGGGESLDGAAACTGDDDVTTSCEDEFEDWLC